MRHGLIHLHIISFLFFKSGMCISEHDKNLTFIFYHFFPVKKVIPIYNHNASCYYEDLCNLIYQANMINFFVGKFLKSYILLTIKLNCQVQNHLYFLVQSLGKMPRWWWRWCWTTLSSHQLTFPVTFNGSQQPASSNGSTL